MPAIPRLRFYQGPVLLSYGFRPFFLIGAAYAGLAMLVWLPVFSGELALTTAFAPRDWHVHEMLYGYLPAVVTGFLLTAVPNWTGRLPLQGAPLLGLVLVWAAGRIAVTLSAQIGWLAAALVDVAFLALVAAATLREIVVGRNFRNVKIPALVSLLMAGNIAFHLEAHLRCSAEYGIRLGIAAIMVLIMVIGGRIIPSFTRNWLARERAGRLPASFARFDAIAIVVSAAALVLWAAAPSGRVSAAFLSAAGMLNFARVARWAGDRTARERLVLILHVGFAFVPIGFLLGALAALNVVPETAGIHAWMAGAAGTMSLAVMTRASLGHTGQTLTASPGTQAIYVAGIVSAVARVWAALDPAWSHALLHLAAFAWAAAFLGFAALFGPLLVARSQVRA